MRHCQIPVSLTLPGAIWNICASSRRSCRVPAQRPAEAPPSEHRWRAVLEFLLLSPLGIFCCLAPRGKVYLFCDDDASHYVKTNLWPRQGVVVAGLGSGLAVPANAFMPTAVLIYSLASTVITNVPSLFFTAPSLQFKRNSAWNFREDDERGRDYFLSSYPFVSWLCIKFFFFVSFLLYWDLQAISHPGPPPFILLQNKKIITPLPLKDVLFKMIVCNPVVRI